MSKFLDDLCRVLGHDYDGSTVYTQKETPEGNVILTVSAGKCDRCKKLENEYISRRYIKNADGSNEIHTYDPPVKL